jgi:hypothetical protein
VGRGLLDVRRRVLRGGYGRLGVVAVGCDSRVLSVEGVGDVQRDEGRRRVHGCRGCAAARERDKQEAGKEGEERGAEGELPVRDGWMGWGGGAAGAVRAKVQEQARRRPRLKQILEELDKVSSGTA